MKLNPIVITIFIAIIAVIGEYYKIKKRNNSTNVGKSPEDVRKKKLYRIITTVVSIFTVAIVAGLLYFATKVQANVTIDKQNITVSAGFLEGCQYKTDDIKDVFMKDTIPPASKIVGTGIGSLRRGSFNVEGLGNGHLYVETDKGPYLYIILKDSFIIINYKDAEKTKGIYNMVIRYRK